MRNYVDVVCERRKPEAGFVDFPFSHPTSDFFFFARSALVYSLPRVAWRLTTERSNAMNAPRTKSISFFFLFCQNKAQVAVRSCWWFHFRISSGAECTDGGGRYACSISSCHCLVRPWWSEYFHAGRRRNRPGVIMCDSDRHRHSFYMIPWDWKCTWQSPLGK